MARTHALIDWSRLRAAYIGESVPLEQPLVDDPALSLVYDPNSNSLGLRARVPVGKVWRRLGSLSNVTVRRVLLDGKEYVEVLTDSVDLFRPIYALASDVLNRVAEGQIDVLGVLEASLSDFEALVASANGMSREKAVGLFGELWVLRELMRAGVTSSACWIGFDQQLHDFRLSTLELEVKTTGGNTRRHTIHGLNQLTPTPGHTLMLVSIRLAIPGAADGESLKDLVEAISGQLDRAGLEKVSFRRRVAGLGYDSADEQCLVKHRLAAVPMAVAVGVDVPELSYAWLHRTIGADSATRIRNVDLTLDLEGLGVPFQAARCMSWGA